jgi:glycosyltransferase involved in cell wall biosynthesis
MLSLHFVNVYPPNKSTSGLFHFARELAAHVRQDDVTSRLSEVPVDRPKDWWNAYDATAGADQPTVAIYQFSPHLFGRRDLTEFAALLAAHRARKRPTIIVWHDANARVSPELGRAARWSYSTLPHLAGTTCLFTETERGHFPRTAATAVIPHFVRSRTRHERSEARRVLDLNPESKIGGVLGFIHPRKGHERTLGLLSPSGPLDELVFAGQFISDEYETHLRGEVQRLGLEGRVHFTGYLADEMFTYWANACDVGLCPFVEVSASGSLSDWFALGRAVVAHRLPQLEFYKARAGTALQLIDTTHIEDFRLAVYCALQLAPAERGSLDQLLSELSPSAVAQRYVHLARLLVSDNQLGFGTQLRRYFLGQASGAGRRLPKDNERSASA